MIEIPLSNNPNQSFSIQLEDSAYNITIKFILNFMTVDIVRNNIVIISGFRIVPGFPFIPYRYLEQGNFLIVTANNEYPNYNQFGITQFMFYMNQADLEVARAGA